MSKPNSEITVDVQVKNKTGNGETESPPNDTTSSTSLSNESVDAARGAPRVRTPTDSSRGRDPSYSNDRVFLPEPWMETVTPGKFDRFQSVIYSAVETIISQPQYEQHAFTKRWNALKRIPKTPMSRTITWRHVKIILGIRDLFDYKSFLQRCPNLNNYIRIQPSMTTTRGFDFGVYDYSSLSSTDDTKSAGKSTTNHSDIDAPTTPEATTTVPIIPSVTPKLVIQELALKTEVEALSDIHAQVPTSCPFTQLSDDTDESYIEVQHVAENPTDTPKHANTNPKNPDESTTTLGLSDLSLPKDIVWSTNDETTGFRIVHYFENTMQQFSSRIDDINTSITGCERGITEQLNSVADRIAAKVSHHMTSITDYATSSLHKFSKETEEISNKTVNAVQALLDKMQESNQIKLQAEIQRYQDNIEIKLEQAIERALQEINNTADEATEDIHNQTKAMLKQLTDNKPQQEHWATAPAKPSKLFPNVDHTEFNKPMLHTTNSNHVDHVSSHPAEWNTAGPPAFPEGLNQGHHKDYAYTNPTGLPMVAHNDILKRINVQYPGREQSYNWYNQIRSGLEQYGVYLISGEEFKKDKSLCPTKMYGIPIEAQRYHTMKSTLYQFLAQRNIVTPDNTDIRNIINKHATTTDGYRAMYDIMKRQHPRLNPDIKFKIPVSSDYAGIHEYYNYITAYYTHEQYSGRNYTEREKINQFLDGLDKTYANAVKRIKSQMDTWDLKDPVVPDYLQLDNLPLKIDQYMEEENDGQPVIHRMDKRNNGNKNAFRDRTPRDKQGAADDNQDHQRQYVDTQCPLCKSFGHQKHQCVRMALWLILKDGSQELDERLKTKLMANYAAVDAKRRARRLARIKGAVRQLYQTGNQQAGDQLMDAYLSPTTYDTGEHSDSDSSETH